jgi:hypothetical protein
VDFFAASESNAIASNAAEKGKRAENEN